MNPGSSIVEPQHVTNYLSYYYMISRSRVALSFYDKARTTPVSCPSGSHIFTPPVPPLMLIPSEQRTAFHTEPPPPPSSRRSPYKSAQKKSPPSNNISIQSESSEKIKDEIREHDDRWLNPIKKIPRPEADSREPPASFVLISLICPRLTFCMRGARLDLWHGRFRRREFIHRHRQPAIPWAPSVGGSPMRRNYARNIPGS